MEKIKKRAPGGGRKPGKNAELKEKRRIRQQSAQAAAAVDAREAAGVAALATDAVRHGDSPTVAPEVAQELKDD